MELEEASRTSRGVNERSGPVQLICTNECRRAIAVISLMIGSTFVDDSEDGPVMSSPSNKFAVDDKAARDSEDRRTDLKSASAKLVASPFILGETAWISAGIGPPRRRDH